MSDTIHNTKREGRDYESYIELLQKINQTNHKFEKEIYAINIKLQKLDDLGSILETMNEIKTDLQALKSQNVDMSICKDFQNQIKEQLNNKVDKSYAKQIINYLFILLLLAFGFGKEKIAELVALFGGAG